MSLLFFTFRFAILSFFRWFRKGESYAYLPRDLQLATRERRNRIREYTEIGIIVGEISSVLAEITRLRRAATQTPDLSDEFLLTYWSYCKTRHKVSDLSYISINCQLLMDD